MKNSIFSKLLPYIYTSILYFVIYIPSIIKPLNKLEITNQFSQLNVTSTDFHINSPTLYILGFIYKFGEKIDFFTVLLILVNFIFIILITKSIEFLKIYQYVFLASGWLLTSSWWIGYVDSILVLCTIIIFKQTNTKNKNSILLFLTVFTLSFSHYVLAFFIILILIILQTFNLKDLISLIAGYVAGIIVNKILLNYLSYDGVSRISYLFNQNNNVLERSVKSISDNLTFVIFSSLMGMFFLFLIYLFIFQNVNIFISLAIVISVTSLSLDTTRTMSILIVPILIKLLDEVSNGVLTKKIEIKYQYFFIFIGILTPFIFPNYHVWDNVVHTVSPFREETNFFKSLIIIINNLIS